MRSPRIFVSLLLLVSCKETPSAGTTPALAAVPSSVVTHAVNTTSSVAPVASRSDASDLGAMCEDLVKPPAGKMPRPVGSRARGVDVSVPAPWKALKEDGFVFGIAQALYGTNKNESFEANWVMMKRCGMARAAYDFLTPQVSGATQAKMFLERVGSDLGDFGPFVDVERPARCEGKCCGTSCEDWVVVVSDWIGTVKKATGRKPVVYTVEDFWKECGCNKSTFALHDLWLAGYPRFDFPVRPGFGGWQSWRFYQHAGNVKAGDAVVDLNVFHGTNGDFRAWLGTSAK